MRYIKGPDVGTSGPHECHYCKINLFFNASEVTFNAKRCTQKILRFHEGTNRGAFLDGKRFKKVSSKAGLVSWLFGLS